MRALLQQATQKFAAAQKALKAGDLEGYAKAQRQARVLVGQALVQADKSTAKPSPSSSTSPSGSVCVGFRVAVRLGEGIVVELGLAVRGLRLVRPRF